MVAKKFVLSKTSQYLILLCVFIAFVFIVYGQYKLYKDPPVRNSAEQKCSVPLTYPVTKEWKEPAWGGILGVATYRTVKRHYCMPFMEIFFRTLGLKSNADSWISSVWND